MDLDATVLRQTPVYKICLYTKSNILQISWNKQPNLPQYLKWGQVMLHVLKKYSIKKILSDCSLRKSTMPQDFVWLSHHFLPHLDKISLEKMAVIVPHDPDDARNLECCLMTARPTYELQFFLSKSQALEWLNEPQGMQISQVQAVA